MSTFLISIYFDKETNEYISGLMSRIAQKTSNDTMLAIPPHITIGMINTDDVEEACLKLESIVKSIKSFEIQLISVGMFGSKVVYIEPVLSKELHELCEMVNRTYAGEIHMSSRYKPFGWLPHITVAKYLTKEQQLEAVKLLQDENVFRNVRIEKIGLATTKPYKDVSLLEIDNMK